MKADRLVWLAAIGLLAGCTGGSSPRPTHPVSGRTASPSAAPTHATAVAFEGDLIHRTTGHGSKRLMTVRLTTDAQLYLQCPHGGAATVTYGAAGVSSCPSRGVPLLAQVSAPNYPAEVVFTVSADQSTTGCWPSTPHSSASTRDARRP